VSAGSENRVCGGSAMAAYLLRPVQCEHLSQPVRDLASHVQSMTVPVLGCAPQSQQRHVLQAPYHIIITLMDTIQWLNSSSAHTRVNTR